MPKGRVKAQTIERVSLMAVHCEIRSWIGVSSSAERWLGGRGFIREQLERLRQSTIHEIVALPG